MSETRTDHERALLRGGPRVFTLTPRPSWAVASPVVELSHAAAVAMAEGPRCGNRMRLLTTIEDPRVVERILTHLGLPSVPVRPAPPHPPPGFAGDLGVDSLV